MTDTPLDIESWEHLEQLIDAGDAAAMQDFYAQNSAHEVARAVNNLETHQQSRVLELLGPEIAADFIEELAPTLQADLIEDLHPQAAAAIVDEMPSDEQADVLSELDEDDATAILNEMDPDEAQDVRQLVGYAWDTAGGLMISEYLCFTDDMTVDDALADLRRNVEEYHEFDVQYLYVVERETEKLRGIGRIKDLVLARGDAPITSVLIDDAVSVNVADDLEALEAFFDRYDYYAVPVVDEHGRLVGAVRRTHVEEAWGERAEEQMLRMGGIITGEELRSMPMASRTLRRLAFLFPTMALALVAISVIAMFEETIEQAPALAIFLPLVAGLCGASGNQAMAVSLRELSLGLVNPGDYARVALKEIAIGAVVGLCLGLAVFIVTMLMRGNPWLALIVAGAVPMTVVVSTMVGGAIPLILRAAGVDPAMVASSLVTMTADVFGFFTVLAFANAMMPYIAGVQ